MVEDSEVSKRILIVEEEDRYVSFNAKSRRTTWCKILSVKMIFFAKFETHYNSKWPPISRRLLGVRWGGGGGGV